MSGIHIFSISMEPLFPVTPNLITKKGSHACTIVETSSHAPQTVECNSLIMRRSHALGIGHEINGTPLIDNMICLLNVAKDRKDARYGCLVYTFICSCGVDGHELLGNYLTPLLIGCKDIETAHYVLQRLVCRNEHSWTALIQGYVDCGDYSQALSLFEDMQEDGVHPNKFTYLATLKSCIEMNWLEKGESLHAEIVKEGFEEDVFVGSILATLYARSGALKEAYDVFGMLPERDVVMWNTLISAMLDHGFPDKALSYLVQMEIDQVFPDVITYACILKACRMMEALDMGRKLHLVATKKGLDNNPLVGCAAVGMYADCRCLEEAQLVFNKLPSRDIVSWSTLISVYATQNLSENALSCLKQMQSEGISPDKVVFANSLKLYFIATTPRGQEAHMEVVKYGFDVESQVSSNLLTMYAKFGLFAEALEVFKQQPARDAAMWNSLMAAYVEHEMPYQALHCFDEMQLEGTHPNDITYICSLNACADTCSIARGYDIHKLVVEDELDQDPFIGNSLVGMYANCGHLVEAREVFDDLSVQDVVSWSALMAGYTDHELELEAFKCLEVMQLSGISPNSVTYVCSLKACGNLANIGLGLGMHMEIARKGLERDSKVGNTLVYMYSKCNAPSEGEKVFDSLLQKDVVSWNAAILGFSEEGDMENTIAFYHHMQQQGVLPDFTTLAGVLQGCGNATGISVGKRIHAIVQTFTGVDHDSIVIMSTALVDMYGKCGIMVDASQVFDEMPTHNITSWTSLITGYAHQGESKLVLELFEKMREEGIQPNGVTFLSVLSACKHGGFADKVQHYLKMMTFEYDLHPTMEHRNCVADIFCRAGRVDEVMEMLNSMPPQPSLVTWSGVLSSCQRVIDVDLATKALNGAVSSAENEAAMFVYLSNAFALANM
ncbi:hypothetical protein GOP47_0021166 [Adiantum capillus-veneris]|uniref:Pentatricopeptide repeat-containing protein n=1 Tax=Adiantum capillus-veneris TaxID=13818 RepID=A0A9D4Z9E8_ADICA|nr:hypothetical protein GOP47_0021166 [Adiantum capillus-veneris]